MIEELKDLLKVIEHLPNYVMWCLAGMLFYKLFVIGNVYALFRLGINKLYDYSTKPKVKEFQYTMDGKPIDEAVAAQLNSLINRLRKREAELGNTYFYSSAYLHNTDVTYLSEALDAKILQDKQKREKK